MVPTLEKNDKWGIPSDITPRADPKYAKIICRGRLNSNFALFANFAIQKKFEICAKQIKDWFISHNFDPLFKIAVTVRGAHQAYKLGRNK